MPSLRLTAARLDFS